MKLIIILTVLITMNVASAECFKACEKERNKSIRVCKKIRKNCAKNPRNWELCDDLFFNCTQRAHDTAMECESSCEMSEDIDSEEDNAESLED